LGKCKSAPGKIFLIIDVGERNNIQDKGFLLGFVDIILSGGEDNVLKMNDDIPEGIFIFVFARDRKSNDQCQKKQTEA
jgi:hypothetical protein